MHFTKMHGLGNDFVVINNLQKTFSPHPTLIRQLAHRQKGIGFDQLLLIEQSNQQSIDFHLRIYNANGGQASQCGNGLRCVARYIYDNELTNKDHFSIATNTGLYPIIIHSDGQVSVNMQPPILTPSAIPFIAPQQSPQYRIETSTECYLVNILSMGNPHCILKVDDVEKIPLDQIGSQIEHHPNFPEGTNVELLQIIQPDRIKLRIHERGVGETLACGSGACAAVVAGRLQYGLAEKVLVEMAGGSLHISWQGDDSPVWMKGEAIKVFEGEVTA